jgi:uncharacterized cupredoxin-like copper-binding protein
MDRVRNSSIVALVVLVMLGLVLAGCGSSGGGSSTQKGLTITAAGGKVTVVAHDLYFNAKQINATAGPLQVTLKNDGAVLHSFVIDQPKFKVQANAGSSATGTVNLTPGSYAYYCDVPGHKATMHGTLVVT